MKRKLGYLQHNLVKQTAYIILIMLFEYVLLKNHFSNQTNRITNLGYPPPKEYRQYHRCSIQEIPHVTSYLETAQYLRFTNSSFTRFGDGEVIIMRGINRYHQRAVPELVRALISVLESDLPNLMIGVENIFTGFPEERISTTDYYFDLYNNTLFLLNHLRYDKQYFTTFISSTYTHSTGTHCILVSEVYKTLWEIWRDRDIVLVKADNGQEYQYDVYDTARSQTIHTVPKFETWKEYTRIKKVLMDESPDKLFILAAGPTATVLTYDLALAGRRALDLGHLAKDYDYYMLKKIPKRFYWDG